MQQVCTSHTVQEDAGSDTDIHTSWHNVWSIWKKKKTDSLSSIHTYTHAHTRIATIHFPSSTFIVSRMKDTVWLVWNPTQSSYTVMCCFALWSSLSGASVNRAIVWSALPKGFTPISPSWFVASLISASLYTVAVKSIMGLGLGKKLHMWKVGVSENCRTGVMFYSSPCSL